MRATLLDRNNDMVGDWMCVLGSSLCAETAGAARSCNRWCVDSAPLTSTHARNRNFASVENFGCQRTGWVCELLMSVCEPKHASGKTASACTYFTQMLHRSNRKNNGAGQRRATGCFASKLQEIRRLTSEQSHCMFAASVWHEMTS